MKRLLVILIALICFSCNKELSINIKQLDELSSKKLDTSYCNIECQILRKNEMNPTSPKVGFVIDTNWFKSKYPGFWIETHNGRGEGDFNNDGRKDLVVMFASNTEAKYMFQKDESSRIVVGVFINNKTYFELDTNMVYSYLGGYSDISVADINHDGYLDIYQMTGYWKGDIASRPTYYNQNGRGGMNSYVFMNNKNKNFTKHTLSIENDGASTISIIFDNNQNGFDEIYSQSCLCYFEFNGNSFSKNKLSLDNNFKNQSYNLNVITPKYGNKKAGMIFTSENSFGETYFILKLENNKLIPKIKFKPTYPNSGPAQEIYVEDLDKDGKFEYVIPMLISENNDNTIPAIPYLMIVDESGTNVTSKFVDDEIAKPLSYEQIDWIGRWQTGFIYYTFVDLDNDGINEILPASGLGYKKGNDSYYYKLIDGKYKLKLYYNGWIGDVHKKEPDVYKVFVDEKNKVSVFLRIEYNLFKSIFKTF